MMLSHLQIRKELFDRGDFDEAIIEFEIADRAGL